MMDSLLISFRSPRILLKRIFGKPLSFLKREEVF